MQVLKSRKVQAFLGNTISILKLGHSMGYFSEIYKSINVIERGFRYKGKCGSISDTRGKRRKATPEQMERQNQLNRIKRIRLYLQANFFQNDIYLTLKYPKGTRKSREGFLKDIEYFQRTLRREYKKRGEELKWIRRLEIGSKGGLHAHYVINRIYGIEILAYKCWKFGSAHFTYLSEEGGMAALAEYFAKELPDETKQLKFIDDDVKQFVRYSRSRNLVEPEKEEKQYKRRTMKRILEELRNGKKEAAEGFYIDKSSIRIGINPYTGYSYCYWRELRINPVERKIRIPENLSIELKSRDSEVLRS